MVENGSNSSNETSLDSQSTPGDAQSNREVETAEKETGVVLIVLDEIDQLIKRAGDGILYNLTRINEELKSSQISLIGI